MKILHITPYYKPAWGYGGPVRSISRLAEMQASEAHDVSVFTTNANESTVLQVKTSEPVEVNYVIVYYHKRNSWIPGFFSTSLLLHLWQEAKSFDVIHVHNWWNLTSIFSLFICYFRGVNRVFSPRGMLSPYTFSARNTLAKSLIQNSIGKLALRGCALHATSEQEAEECRHILPGIRSFVLPNLIELPNARATTSNGDTSEFKLIYLSRVHPKKGLHLLFQALQNIDLNWSLRIVGDGEADYIGHLKELAQSLEITPKIHWLGRIDGEARFDLLANADLMVLPSSNENFANAVLESLALGTAVLLSPMVGLSDFVVKNQLGWAPQPEVNAIRESLIQAAQDLPGRSRIRTEAPKLVRQHFSPKVLVAAYVQEYQKATA